MNDDTHSTASLDSAGDKEAVDNKQPRATKEEIAAKLAAELAELKAVDLSSLTEAKRDATVAKIDKLEAQVKVDELARSRSKFSRTGSGTSIATRSQVSDEEMSRLIFARTALDHKFQQHVNSAKGKWAKITDKFNNGFVVSKDELDATVDDRFERLSKEKYRTGDALCRKWEKVRMGIEKTMLDKTYCKTSSAINL